ncbi:hypothetical protein J2X11_000460 [Aeromicrobium panaciterrae]|uniref:DUF3352 domain-containing protein n=1 Tax=Aeromicrobium panaciterrae TaxID=363861 RepID=A0ABU1UKC2_9ACTN|nr:hypothetical protein [Aeromicrobium panaciterrae]MDR7085621.1 hypothetical protein [Aeromicrobium panaciterrae]
MTEETPAVIEPTKRSRKRFLILGVAAGMVLGLVAVGAFAWQKLSGGGAQPHDVLPSTVVAYARIDADPSASQKIAILRLIRKFPELAKELGIKDVNQDVRKPLLEDLVAECDLDYDKDIEPWIGHRIGVAYDSELETPIVAVQISDEDKARIGINALADCGGPDSKTGIAFLDGYALVTPRKADAAAASKAASKKSLADNTTFSKDTDELGEQGVFSAWADLEGISKSDAIEEAFGAEVEDAFAGASTAAVTLRASSSSLELASIAHLDEKPDVVESTNLADLPEDTALAFAISGFGDQAKEQFDKGFMSGFAADGVDAEEELKAIEEEFGFKLPEDLETLLGDGLMLAVGGRNLETLPMLSGPDDVAQLDIGLKLTTDPTKGADLAKRLVDLAADVGFSLVASPTDDGVVIATNPEAAEAFSGNGKLGDSKNFKEAVAHPGAFPAMFVNIDTILEALLASNPPPDVEDVLNELEPLSAFAVSSTFDDKLIKATLRLTLD